MFIFSGIGTPATIQSTDRCPAQFWILNGMLHWKPKIENVLPRRVVPMSEAFDRIKQVHAQLGHAGYVKTFKSLHEPFCGNTKEQVQ
jgi:hypothetical protein